MNTDLLTLLMAVLIYIITVIILVVIVDNVYRFINKIVAFFKKYKHKQGYVNNLILYIYSRYLFYKGLEEYKKGKIKTVKDLDDFLEKL